MFKFLVASLLTFFSIAAMAQSGEIFIPGTGHIDFMCLDTLVSELNLHRNLGYEVWKTGSGDNEKYFLYNKKTEELKVYDLKNNTVSMVRTAEPSCGGRKVTNKITKDGMSKTMLNLMLDNTSGKVHIGRRNWDSISNSCNKLDRISELRSRRTAEAPIIYENSGALE